MKLGIVAAVVALCAIGSAVANLQAARSTLSIDAVAIDQTPATIYRPSSPTPAPVVVIAHGFAGSQQLMQSFALALAHAGYIAVTFDFAGHGRNPAPLTGSITEEDGATQTLVAETARVASFARKLGDGRLAVLGHSMASDIIVRFADADAGVSATIAVSMFSPAVTATAPANLLVIAGGWEGMLKLEALRAVGLASAPLEARPGVTYGSFAQGTARRAAFSANVEHVGVLFSSDSLRETVSWLDGTFGIVRAQPQSPDARGSWILVLLGGVVLLGWPLSKFLPVVADPPVGAGFGWRKLAVALGVPMLATPLLLAVLPTHFLPVLVADYLAAHFALYGIITAGCIAYLTDAAKHQPSHRMSYSALATAAAGLIAYGFLAIVWPINSEVTSFIPGPERVLLVAAMLVGTLAFFLSDEWLTRGAGSARGAYLASKVAFLTSLALAVGLDFKRLFFLIIIVPVIVLFFLVYGLFSTWAYQRTGHPFVAGLATAVAFAWAIGVSFPLLAG